MKTDKKVAVLLSAYNGERYIAEQVDSILHQTYPNLHLYIRDDCSTDGTLQVLEQYREDPRVTLIRGSENLGYPEGFYELLRTVTDADYYSFSDQDDVWEPDKIARAVTGLSRRNPNLPAMFFANYEIYDEKLNFIRLSPCLRTKPGFLNSLYACLGLGFTIVLNTPAKKMITNQRSVYGETKDVWIGMLCSAFGEIIFDRKSCAKHRRNPGAYSAESIHFWKTQKERFRELFLNDGFTYIHTVMQEFYDTYRGKLQKDDEAALSLLVDMSRRPSHVLKKVFFPRRLRYEWKDEIMLRLVFLIGRL